MRFPGITYSFKRPTDVSGPTALILSRHEQTSSGSAFHSFTFSDLAKDRVLVLTNVAIRGVPGSNQTVEEIALQGLSQGVLNFNIARSEFPIINGLAVTLNWQGEVYIQGGGDGTDTLRIFVQYDAGVQANTSTIGIHGIVIPRGNLGGF